MELVADALTKKLGKTVALDGVSFKLEGTGCFGYLVASLVLAWVVYSRKELKDI